MKYDYKINAKKGKHIKLAITSIIIFILIIGIIIGNLIKKNEKIDNKFRILTSFYPLYIMLQNITDGSTNVEISNMADKMTGCIHDYTLTTTDLKKFEKADVFIENGNNLENFTQKIIEIYPNVKVIESGKNISDIIEEDDEINPHIWLSIENYITQVLTISKELEILNNENDDIYLNNSKKYIEKLEKLKLEYESIQSVENKKAICLNESLEYLLKDSNIEVTSIETDHEQSVLSAEVLKNTIDKMKKENIKAIFIDKNDDDKIAKILETETNANTYILNSEMNGNGNNDDYLNVMMENLKILKNVKY